MNTCLDADDIGLALDEQKDKARESLAEISAVLTRPSDDPKINPRRRYTLRGVSTEPHITYVLCAMEGEDANNASVNQENREEGHEMATKNYQWWRMSFTSGDSNPVSKTVSYGSGVSSKTRQSHFVSCTESNRRTSPTSRWRRTNNTARLR